MDKILLLNPPGDKLFQRDMYCSGVSKAHYYWPSIDMLVLSGILGQEYDLDILDGYKSYAFWPLARRVYATNTCRYGLFFNCKYHQSIFGKV